MSKKVTLFKKFDGFLPFFLKFFEARLYRVSRKAVMDLEDLKNVLSAKGEIMGFCGIFTEAEILQKIAELPIKRAKFVAINFAANPEMPLEVVLKIVKEVEQICSKKTKIVFDVKTHKLLGEKIKAWLLATGI